MITRRDEALEKGVWFFHFFSSLQNAICYTVRILCILNTFSILDDFIFFFSTRREQGNLTFVTLIHLRHISCHDCPSFSPRLADVIIKDGFILSTNRFTLSRACRFGKISRNCLDLLDTPFHTFPLVFHTFLGLRSFSFLVFLPINRQLTQVV